MPLAFAPFGIWPLAMLSPAVLLLGWRRVRAPRAAWRGWLYGCGMFGAGVSWIHHSFQFANIGSVTALGLTAALAALLALYPALIGAALARVGGARGGLWLVGWCPAAWVLGEWVRGWLFTGFTWLDLGYSQIDTWFAALLPLGGVLGVSYAVMLIAGLGAWAVTGAPRARLAAAGVVSMLVLVAAAFGTVRWTGTGGPPIGVALVQGNIAQAQKWLPRMRAQTLERYRRLTLDNRDADLVIWPESALPGFHDGFADFLAALERELEPTAAALVFGVPSRAGGAPLNSVFALGHARGMYHKRHLVPFGEYLPLAGLLGPLVRAAGIRVADFVPGAARQSPIEAAGVTLGTFVCYEIAFGNEVRRALPGAAVLLTLSNDAWFGASIGPAQHLQIARARAAETGRWLIRATNTGITALVAPDGSISARAPQFEPLALRGEVTPMRGLTPYARVGDLALVALCLVVLGAGLWWSRARR